MIVRGTITMLAAIAGLATPAAAQKKAGDPIPYSEALELDAERLAELGIVEVYDEIEPVIASHGGKPDSLREIIDKDSGHYAIEHRGIVYLVSGGAIDQYQGWGNAAAVFFEIVNRQMAGSRYRLYALGHGNDMVGVFLTNEQFARAVALYANTKNAPFVPTRDAPWFGLPHDGN